MELNQLKDYLKTIVDLESARYSCETVIGNFQQTLNELSIELSKQYVIPSTPQRKVLPEPVYPERPVKPSFLQAFVCALGTGVLPKIVLSIIFLAIYYGCFDPDFLLRIRYGEMWLYILLEFLLMSLILTPLCYNDGKEDVKKYEQTISDIKANHEEVQADMDEEYRKRCEYINEYIKKLEFKNQFLDKQRTDIVEELIQLKKRKKYLEHQLRELYSYDVVYPTYRNLAAMAQIYDYIASGLVTKLEGSDGAYAQYMQDVRTNRICNSIEEMGNRISNAITTLQRTFVEEIYKADHAMYSINSTLSRISKETIQYSSDMLAQNQSLIQYTEEMNQQLKNININTALTNYNQYLDMKSRNVDGYFAMYK